MPAHMKTPRISAKVATITVKPSPDENTAIFEIPKAKLSSFLGALKKIGTPVTEEESVSAEDVFKDLDKKYGRAGSILKGARIKEGLTQKELAEKADIEQADLSKMETGKLTIGRERAKRLGEVLGIDYRLFLFLVVGIISMLVWKGTWETNGVKHEIQITDLDLLSRGRSLCIVKMVNKRLIPCDEQERIARYDNRHIKELIVRLHRWPNA